MTLHPFDNSIKKTKPEGGENSQKEFISSKVDRTYMDLDTILPATETIRRALERVAALYETSQKRNVPGRHSSKSDGGSRRHKKTASDRDISEYQANEPAPTDAYFSDTLARLLSLAAQKPDTVAKMRRYVDKWSRWLKLGLTTSNDFEVSVQNHLPGIFACWIPGVKGLPLGSCQ